MISNIIVKNVIRVFFSLIILFYLVGMMYRQGYTATAAQFEPALIIILVGILFNMGPYLSTSVTGRKFRKITICGLLLSAIANFFMFLLVEGNPFYFLNDGQWGIGKSICLFLVPLVSVLIAIFMGLSKDDA